MSEHIKEPWSRVRNGSHCMDFDIKGGIGATIVRNITDDVSRRIVACVNACAGIPTELLEKDLISPAKAIVIKEQRDELLATLKASESALRSYQYGNTATELAEEVADKAADAIAKVK